MTTAREFQDRYTKLLKGYVAEQGEKFLLEASELGREMVLAGLPAENVAELHAVALHAVIDVVPPVPATVAEFASTPLAELLMAYGLASRAQVSSLESARLSLEQSERRFRDFADASSDWMWETGPDLRYAAVTDGVKQMIGRAPEDYVGKTRWELSHPDEDPEKWSAHVEDLRARRPFHDFVYTMLDGDGRERIIRDAGKPAFDDDGAFLGYRGTGRDITALVEAEERATRIRRRLGESLESISEGFSLFDAEGRLVACNSRYRKSYPLIADVLIPGIAFDEILRTAVERGRFPEAEGRVDDWVHERLTRHLRQLGIVECLLSDGRWYRISEHSTREGGIVKVLTDITEIKEREETLANQSAVLEATLENMDEGISLIDADLNAVAFNRRFLELLEFPADRFRPGDKFEDFIRFNAERGEYGPGDVGELVRQRVERAKLFEPHRFERARPDGTVIEVRGNPTPDGGFVTTYADITERKRAEEALQARARQQQAVAELGLVAMATSDLSALMDRVVAVVAETLDVELCKVLEVQPGGEALLLRAGVGWKEGLVGNATVPADTDSQAGYTLHVSKPVIVEDFAAETRFRAPALLRDHGVVCGVSVIIPGEERPFGVLGVHSTEPRTFSSDDSNFMLAVANLLAGAISREGAMRALRESEERFRAIFDNSPAPMCLKGIDGKYLLANKALKSWLGTDSDEILEMTSRDVFSEETAVELMAQDRKVLEEGVVVDTEMRRTFPDGVTRDTLLTKFPLLAPDGRPAAVGVINTDITERKRAEEALKESEERMRHVTDAVPVLIADVDTNRQYRFANKRYLEWFDIKDEVLAGMHTKDVIGEKFFIQIDEHVTRALAGEEVSYEGTFEYEDGRTRHFHATYIPRFGDSGEVLGYYSLVQDLSELKRAEKAVRESEQHLRGVLDNVVHGIVTIDERGLIESFNAGAEELFGYAAAEVIGKNVNVLMPEPDHGRHDGYLENYLKTGKSAILGVGPRELRGRRKDGKEVPVELAISEMRLDGRRVFIGVLVDLTERKKAERKNALLAGIVNHLPDAVEVCDTDLRIKYVNPSHEKTTGYAASEVLGRAPAELFRPPDGADPTLYEEIESTIFGGGVWKGEFEALRKDGSAWNVEAEIFPVHDERGTITRYVAIKRDVTNRLRVEHQLQQAQKMDAVGQLTGGVAHDFNNLLTVILGNLQLLERQAGDDERLLKRVTAAARAARSGADLTARLLAFSRRQVLEPKVLDLNRLVCGMDDLLRRTLGEATEIQTVLAADLWLAEVDPAQMETTLLNLAVNARDAMPDGGQLTIETANMTLDENYAATHEGVKAGDYVMVAVTDTGTGMPPEIVEQVFEPFFTTKETGKGTGLGLSMVFGFVKQSGGNVSVYSEEGHGTTMRLYFPRSVSADAATDKEAPVGEEISGGSETILVVEDDAGVREVTVGMLEELGYRVLEAGNGMEALAVLDQHADIDLLFTDMVMPGGMSGPALGKQVEKRLPDIKVLYASGYAHSAFTRDGKLDPNVRLIGKPFQNNHLAREVRRILDGK